MISIRLSEEEFGRIQDCCETSGAPTISEFARAAIHHFLDRHDGKDPNPSPAERQFRRIDRRLTMLEKHVDQLALRGPDESLARLALFGFLDDEEGDDE